MNFQFVYLTLDKHLRLIEPLTRNDVTHTTSRILNITSSSRNQVHMTVKDGLTCSLTAIHPDVETVNRWIFSL